MLRGMPRLGEPDDVPHTLIPLGLAVVLIRAEVYGGLAVGYQGREGELNAVAGILAGLAPLYEYSPDPGRPPRRFREDEIQGGVFRNGGVELRFNDGRSPKRHLAVNTVEVELVTEVLKDPAHAVIIRSRFTRLRAQKLKARARAVREAAARLRTEAVSLRVHPKAQWQVSSSNTWRSALPRRLPTSSSSLRMSERSPTMSSTILRW